MNCRTNQNKEHFKQNDKALRWLAKLIENKKYLKNYVYFTLGKRKRGQVALAGNFTGKQIGAGY